MKIAIFSESPENEEAIRIIVECLLGKATETAALIKEADLALYAAKKAGLELHTFLDVLNNSSGVNFATLNRFRVPALAAP